MFPIRINLKLFIFEIVGTAPWSEDQSLARSLPTQENRNKHEKQARSYASSRIRTHDPSDRASEGISLVRPRDHCDRPLLFYNALFTTYKADSSIA
jgi:hypothetical protein